jgi:AraC-like DNA-binding protein
MTDQGFLVERFVVDKMKQEKGVALEAHRDDHYIFLMQECGRSRMMIDFAEYGARGRRIMTILPGQVHKYLSSEPETVAWFVALDVGMVAERYRSVLEDPLLPGGAWALTEDVQAPLIKCLELIMSVGGGASEGIYDRQVMYGLLTVFVAMVTSIYAGGEQEGGEVARRPRLITQAFRVLLGQRYKALKRPAAYAAEMNLSLSYLNEVVKTTTGFPVSHWIHHEVMLEAKRLLFHSDCSVKEVAHELGYDDHAYFSRLFVKMTGRTPGAFRRYYRE